MARNASVFTCHLQSTRVKLCFGDLNVEMPVKEQT